jgi:hypothetical protein
MRQRPLFIAASSLCIASLVVSPCTSSLVSAAPANYGSLPPANAVTYNVTINTASILGTAGSLDFSFSPGPLVTQSASLQVINFTSDGKPAGDCPCGTGDVGGQLPTTLTFDNGAGFNDYFDDFIFGKTISFQLSLYGPAVSSPNGVSSSGSILAFSMFFDQAGSFPVLTSDTANGSAFTVSVNLDGTTTVSNFSPETSIPSSLPLCLHDDHTEDFIQFNSLTGNYLFTDCGTGGFTLSGKGTVAMASGILMIMDKETGSSVTISYNPGSLTGTAVATVNVATGVSETYRISDTNPHPVCTCGT